MCAVSYLNTVPLVWGMLHGDERRLFDLSFCLPSECAERLEDGSADIGIVPVVELPRLGLEIIRGTGIASHGAVRSILLITKKPLAEIRTLAADSGSRTSVVLARILLAELHGAVPRFISMAPELGPMLDAADAALIIGDPALRLNMAELPYEVVDLSEEWTRMTGKPMVFAVWAGARSMPCRELEPAFAASCRFGIDHIEKIITQESQRRGLPAELARDYLTRHIVFELGEDEYGGMELFLQHAASLTGTVSV